MNQTSASIHLVTLGNKISVCRLKKHVTPQEACSKIPQISSLPLLLAYIGHILVSLIDSRLYCDTSVEDGKPETYLPTERQ